MKLRWSPSDIRPAKWLEHADVQATKTSWTLGSKCVWFMSVNASEIKLPPNCLSRPHTGGQSVQMRNETLVSRNLGNPDWNSPHKWNATRKNKIWGSTSMRQNRCHAMQSQLYQLSTTQCLQLKAIYKWHKKTGWHVWDPHLQIDRWLTRVASRSN